MTENQLPLAVIVAALSGGVAGLFALHSWGACIAALFAAITVNILGWPIYGYSVNIQQGSSFTPTQMLAGFLLSVPGLLLFLVLPLLVTWLLSAVAMILPRF